MSTVKPLRIVYSSQEVAFEIHGVAAFCREHSLDLQGMRDMLRGRTKEYKGWHLDEERTEREEAEIVDWCKKNKWTLYDDKVPE